MTDKDDINARLSEDIPRLMKQPISSKQINTFIICGIVLGLAVGFYAGSEYTKTSLILQLLEKPEIVCGFTNQTAVPCLNNIRTGIDFPEAANIDGLNFLKGNISGLATLS